MGLASTRPTSLAVATCRRDVPVFVLGTHLDQLTHEELGMSAEDDSDKVSKARQLLTGLTGEDMVYPVHLYKVHGSAPVPRRYGWQYSARVSGVDMHWQRPDCPPPHTHNPPMPVVGGGGGSVVDSQ